MSRPKSAAQIAAWEWAAEIRRRLERRISEPAIDLRGLPNDWDELQLATFEREYARAQKRPRDIFVLIARFCGEDERIARAIAGSHAAIVELRRVCEGEPRWYPMDYRRRGPGPKAKLPPNARAALGEAAIIAADLVRLHFGRSGVEVGLLEDLHRPDGGSDGRDVLGWVWEVAPSRIAEAVYWCDPRNIPREWRVDLVAIETARQIIEEALRAPEIGEAKARTRAHESEDRRGGPDDAAFLLLEALAGVDRDTVYACFRERHRKHVAAAMDDRLRSGDRRAEIESYRRAARAYAAISSELVPREISDEERRARIEERRARLNGEWPARGWLRERIRQRSEP